LPATYGAIALVLGLSVLLVTRIERKPMPQPDESEGIVKSLAGGVRYVVGHQVLLSSMALDLFAVFFGGAMAMLPVYAADILGVGPSLVGCWLSQLRK
ncbi:MAG: MFS transporter, partial [bacterium]|nr:MFS transporter [bacterium]